MKKVLSKLLVLISLVPFSGYASGHGRDYGRRYDSGQVKSRVGFGSEHSNFSYYDTRGGSYPGVIANHCDQGPGGIDEDCVASLPIVKDYCDARFSQDCH